MVEVYVGRNDVFHLRSIDLQLLQRRQHVGDRVLSTGFDYRHLVALAQQVYRGDARFDVERIDTVDTLRQR